MVGSHVAHDGVIGNGVILANHVLLAGHVTVGDRAIMNGAAACHHFTTIGRFAYVGGLTRITRDIPPFTIAEGHPVRIRGANVVGMRARASRPRSSTRTKRAIFDDLRLGRASPRASRSPACWPSIPATPCSARSRRSWRQRGRPPGPREGAARGRRRPRRCRRTDRARERLRPPRRPPRVAVVGVGGFGRHHARIYGELAAAGEAALVGLVDLDPGEGARARREVQRPARPPRRGPAGARRRRHDRRADDPPRRAPPSRCSSAASTASSRSPSPHRAPRRASCVDAARRGGAVLQVGHVERFNPVMTAVEKLGIKPVFLEVHRLAPYTFRSSDVGVVMDLMIHDLDIVLHLVGEEPIVGRRRGRARDRDEGGHRQRPPALPLGLRRQRHREPRLDQPDAQDPRLLARRVRLARLRQEAGAARPQVAAPDRRRTRPGGGGRGRPDRARRSRLRRPPLDRHAPDRRRGAARRRRSVRSSPRSRARAQPRVAGEQGAKALALAERILAEIASHPIPVPDREHAA